jgi:uncharacterized protein YifE (UPF0438 family)
MDSFECSGKFYADRHYPYGLARSGDFNRQQATLLETHGRAYEALHNGTREPANEEESRFLAVCRGEAEAVTPHEKAWLLFQQKVAKRSAGPLYANSRFLATDDECNEDDLADDMDDL